MFGRLARFIPNIFSRRAAVGALAATGAVGLGYHLLNPRAPEPALPSEVPPTPEQLGAKAAVEDFSRQMEAMAQAPRLNPRFNEAMPQLMAGQGMQHQGMVAGPELAMGRA